MDRSEINVADLINADIGISEIVNVYKIDAEDKWAGRKTKAPRHSDAILFAIEGDAEYGLSTGKTKVHKNCVFTLFKDEVYPAKSISEKSNCFYVIDFNTVGECEFRNFPLPRCFEPKNADVIKNEFERLFELWQTKKISSNLLCRSLLYELLCDVLISYSSSLDEGSAHRADAVTEALAYINRELSDPDLSVASVCENLYISESQFRRNFNKVVGVSPLEYIRLQRINKSKNLLLYSDMPIRDIASACGFSSLYYFSRSFRLVTGESPTKYKNDPS